MPINAISNQMALGRTQSNKNVQTYNVIPPISSKKSVRFSGTGEKKGNATNYKIILESIGAVVGSIGFGLDFFGKKLNISKTIPIALEVAGTLGVLASFFVKDNSKK